MLTPETFAFTPSEMTEETTKFESGMLSYIESYGQPFLTLNDGKIIYLEFRGGGYGFYDGKFDYVMYIMTLKNCTQLHFVELSTFSETHPEYKNQYMQTPIP